MAAAILNAAKFLPATMARQLLGKVNPKFNNYFSQAASYGLDLNHALDYLVERFGGGEDIHPTTQKKESEGRLRPDEAAGLQQVRASHLPGKALRSGLAYGAGAILPGLGSNGEEVTPMEAEGEAGKAIEKAEKPLSPEQLQSLPLQARPLPAKLGVEKLGVINPRDVKAEPADSFLGFISKHPDLGNYITKKVNEGLSPIDAAKAARRVPKFKPIIQKIESSIGESLEELVGRLIKGKVPTNKMAGVGEALNQVQGKPSIDEVKKRIAMRLMKGING